MVFWISLALFGAGLIWFVGIGLIVAADLALNARNVTWRELLGAIFLWPHAMDCEARFRFYVKLAFALITLVMIFSGVAGAQVAPVDGWLGSMIEEHAKREGLDPLLMRRIAMIESSGNPYAVTGSYKGLFQLSEEEFRQLGGWGSIFDPAENTRIAMKRFRQLADDFKHVNGRKPTPNELYLSHQQGLAGITEHLNYPDRPAWKAMAATQEGRKKGEAWAKKAIWGNIPGALKATFGSVEWVTSSDFIEVWRLRVEGKSAPEQPAVIAQERACIPLDEHPLGLLFR